MHFRHRQTDSSISFRQVAAPSIELPLAGHIVSSRDTSLYSVVCLFDEFFPPKLAQF